jgi:hypothetical protein
MATSSPPGKGWKNIGSRGGQSPPYGFDRIETPAKWKQLIEAGSPDGAVGRALPAVPGLYESGALGGRGILRSVSGTGLGRRGAASQRRLGVTTAMASPSQSAPP